MTQTDPVFIALSRQVFANVAGLTLHDIRERVAASEAGIARRDMLSALDTMTRAYGRPLAMIRASVGSVRELFGQKSGAEVGLSAKRLANVRSEVANALRLYGEPVPAITKRIPLAHTWSHLLELIKVPHHMHALRRLASFCSAMDVSPPDVNHHVLLGFVAALEAEEVVKGPRKLLKHTIAIWNICRRGVQGWPQVALSSPYKKQPYTIPLDSFPESFRTDVANWVARVTNPDPFDFEALARPLRASTVTHRIVIFRRFASALVHRSVLPLEEITSLNVFFSHDNFRSGLRFFLERFGGESTASIFALATNLRSVAKYHCKRPPETIKDLDAVCKRLDPKKPRMLSERNRERLRQFDDPKNVMKLLEFPKAERARGRNNRNSLRAARCMERALAIEILIECALRMMNLRAIHLNWNLRTANDKIYLGFKDSEVKNRRSLEFEASDELAKNIREFCSTYRPLLPGSAGPYLFSGINGGPKSDVALRVGIKTTLRKNAGLIMNPHLFRHAIAKIVTERNPELYAAVSQHLGHSRLEMTMAHYLGTETRASGRHINRLLRNAAIHPDIAKD